MPNPLADSRPCPTRIARVGLQLAGFVATSHWLSLAIQWVPGFEQSGLARTSSAAAADAAPLLSAFLEYALLPGLLEELLYRGLLYAILLRFGGPRLAIGVSALVFGAVHLDPHHASVATLLGLQLGLLRALYGLPLVIVAHITNNTLALLTATAGSIAPAGPDVPESVAGAFLLLLALTLSGISCASLVQSARSQLAPSPASPSALQTGSVPDD